jgi:exosortase D (VPLPA-CTERM-specific)
MKTRDRPNNLAINAYSQWASIMSAILVFAALLYAFRDGLLLMVDWWEESPEYNHGYLIPVVAAYLLLLCADKFRETPRRRALSGLLVVGTGLLLLILGELSTVYTIIQYGFLITLIGLVIYGVGWHAAGTIWVPLAYLFFMIPLPDFIYAKLSNELQLLSSQFGVAFLRLVGISVYLEGNVIDLGVFQLQVAEACSGLRYLFPLMSFGFLCAYLFQGKTWQKVFIFLSSIPITLLMNSFRVGVIGVLVEYYGISMARGFLHDFEGWIVFMACVGILFVEMWLFSIANSRKFSEVFDVRVPPLSNFRFFLPDTAPSFVSGILIATILATSFATMQVQDREEIIPDVPPLNTFPLSIADWRGDEQAIEKVYLDQLKLSNYFMATYARPDDSAPVDLYIAYYESQRKGAAVHSPKACLPGGGWDMVEFDQVYIDSIGPAGEPLKANRVLIKLDDSEQLVYYWFHQRDRNITNEYLVKWFIFWDALIRNRTDGSLIRIVTPIMASEDVKAADERIINFIKDTDPARAYFLPGQETMSDAG